MGFSGPVILAGISGIRCPAKIFYQIQYSKQRQNRLISACDKDRIETKRVFFQYMIMNAVTQDATASRLKLLPFGACQIGKPLAELHRLGLVRNAFTEAGFESAPFVYTVKSARQLLEVLAGKASVDTSFIKFCFTLKEADFERREQVLSETDLAVIEPNYPIDIIMDDLVLSRQLIKRHLTDPLSALGPQVKRLCYIWKTKGILEQNEDVRQSAADALLQAIPDDLVDAQPIRQVIKRARGVLSDDREVAADINILRHSLGIPCVMSLYTYRYNEDGDAETKPVGFRTSIKKMAQSLDLPLLDLSGLVRRVGIDNALRADQRHFCDQFVPLAARSLLYFLQRHAERLGIPASKLSLEKASAPKAERHALRQAAREAERTGQLGLALDHYRAILEADSNDTGALIGRRRLAQRLGLRFEAYEAAELLAKREPHISAHAVILAKYAKLARLDKTGPTLEVGTAN